MMDSCFPAFALSEIPCQMDYSQGKSASNTTHISAVSTHQSKALMGQYLREHLTDSVCLNRQTWEKQISLHFYFVGLLSNMTFKFNYSKISKKIKTFSLFITLSYCRVSGDLEQRMNHMDHIYDTFMCPFLILNTSGMISKNKILLSCYFLAYCLPQEKLISIFFKSASLQQEPKACDCFYLRENKCSVENI